MMDFASLSPRTLELELTYMQSRSGAFYDRCALRNQTRVRFQSSTTKCTTKLFEVIHSDVCGPMATATLGERRYFVTFIDGQSKYCVVYLTQEQVCSCGEDRGIVVLAETQTGMRVKIYRAITETNTSPISLQSSARKRDLAKAHATIHPSAQWCG